MKPLAHLGAVFFSLVLTAIALFLVFREHAALGTSLGLQLLVGGCMVAAPLLAIPARAQAAAEAVIALWRKFKGGAS
jgi:hypothetical protein